MKLLHVFIAVIVLTQISSLHAQEIVHVYIGTFTNKDSKGIYRCELNTKDGTLTKAELVAETVDPSFLAIHPSKKFLYCVNAGKAAISSFAIDEKTGDLTFLNSKPSGGKGPCHLIVDPKGKNVLAANYGGGSCLCIPLNNDGTLSDRSSFHQHSGEKPHGHSIHVDPTNKFALCCDLGLDQVIVYKFDPEQGNLTNHGTFDTPKGAGPRHFAWYTDGKTCFINGEKDLSIIVCEFDSNNGKLEQKQVLSTLPADVKQNGGSTAEVVVHPSGKFVYVSNRDPYNSIAIFRFDQDTKTLTPVGHQSKDIKTPRNFAIDPTGKFMLVANMTGDNVIVFRIDQESGKLIPTSISIDVPKPVCVRFW